MRTREATAYRIMDVEMARPAIEAATSPQGEHVFINTPHGIRSLGVSGCVVKSLNTQS